MRQCLEVIHNFGDSTNMLEKKLSNGPKKVVLWHICHDNSLSYSGKKVQLIDNIIEWVCKFFPLLKSPYIITVVKRSQHRRHCHTPPGTHASGYTR